MFVDLCWYLRMQTHTHTHMRYIRIQRIWHAYRCVEATTYIYMYVYIHMYMRTYMYIYIYTYMYACMYLSMSICIHIYIYTCISVHSYGFLQICIYIYIDDVFTYIVIGVCRCTLYVHLWRSQQQHMMSSKLSLAMGSQVWWQVLATLGGVVTPVINEVMEVGSTLTVIGVIYLVSGIYWRFCCGRQENLNKHCGGAALSSGGSRQQVRLMISIVRC